MRANSIDVPSSTGIATRVTINSLFIMRPMPPFLLPRRASSYIFSLRPLSPLPSFSTRDNETRSPSPEIRRIFSTNDQLGYDVIIPSPSRSVDMDRASISRHPLITIRNFSLSITFRIRFILTNDEIVFYARLIKRTLFHLKHVVSLCSWNDEFYNKMKHGITICKYECAVKFLDKDKYS